MRFPFFVALLLLISTSAHSAPEKVFRAGAAAIDITPEKFPVIVNGMFEERTAMQAHDPLHARALVLDDGTTRLAIAVVDSCMLPRELLDDAKRLASKSTGIPVDRILISATHTHSAPSAMGALGSDADPDYPAFLVPRLAAAIEEAAKNLATARIGWGAIQDAEHTNVRRYIRRPDRMLKDPFGELTVRAHMHPGYRFGKGDAVGPSGPKDPGLSMLAVQMTDGKPLAVLANYSMHYYSSPMLSADYFGLFVAKFGELINADPSFVGIMSQGTSGDVWLADYSQPERKETTLEQYSEAVAASAHLLYRQIEYRDWVSLAMSESKLTLRRRVPDERRLAWARQVVASLDGAKPKVHSDIYAREQIMLHEEPQRELKLQAIRVGDCAITAIPNEVYALTGLKLKAMSPLETTFNISLANGSEGYIPPPEQHTLGGYTTWPARTAGLEVHAEPKIVEAVVKLLEDVTGQPRRPLHETHGEYAAAVIDAKPLAYWRMGEMHGPTAIDSSGQGVNGTYEHGVVFHLDGPASNYFSGALVPNRAAHFAGGRMKADLQRLGATYTVEMWFWNGLSPEARPVTGYHFSFGADRDENAAGDHLGIGGTDAARGRLFFFNGNQRNTIIPGKSEIEPRTWNHVALVRQGDRVAIYLNGQEEAGGVADAATPRASGQLFFGGRNDNFANWEGKLDEIAIYNRALTPKEIATRFTSAAVPKTSQPKAQTPSPSGGEGRGEGEAQPNRTASVAANASTTPPFPGTPGKGRGEGSASKARRNSPPRDSDPKSPDDSLSLLHVKPGYEVELVASEPLTTDPVAIDWGPDGRLWVVEMADYPMGMDGNMKPGGRVKFLEDTDADGKYDKSTLFLDNLNFPNGILVWRNGVIVTAAPEIFYAEDTNGDGKADKRRTLFRGFKEGNLQLRVNGLRLGLDGWVYCANGWSGGDAVSEKTGAKIDLGGRDLRIKPDTGEIEAIAGVSQFGRNRDDWGNWFGTDNSHPLFHFLYEDRYLRRNPHLAVSDPKRQLYERANPKLFPRSRGQKRFHSFEHAGHFTSACSGIIYRDELLFGPGGHTHAFVCDPVHNLVQHMLINDSGESFRAVRAPDETDFDFLASEDPWFRPVMVRDGPDGALWVVDMYRYMIEHPHWLPAEGQRELLPFYRDGADQGRIYRVYPKGKRPPAYRGMPDDNASLVETLENTNGWRRDRAQQMLTWRGAKDLAPALEKMTKESKHAVGRLHALSALDQLDLLPPNLLEKALSDEHPGVRRWAIVLSEKYARQHPQLVAEVCMHENDRDPRVNMQVASTITEWEGRDVEESIRDLVDRDMMSPVLMTALLTAPPKSHVAIINRCVSSGWGLPVHVRRALLPMALAANDRDTLLRLLEHVIRDIDDEYAESYPEFMPAYADWLDLLATKRISQDDLARPDDKLSAYLKRIRQLHRHARRVAADPEQKDEYRRSATLLLGREKQHADEELRVLSSLLGPTVSSDLQLAAVKALGRIQQPQVVSILTRDWPSHGPALRAAILDQLLTREQWIVELLNLIDAKRLAAIDIDVPRRERLLRHKSPQIKALAERLFKSNADANRQQIVEQNRPVLEMKSDARRGAKVFSVHCASCHRVENLGQDVGPNLAAVRSWSGEALLTAILDPDRQVEPRYLSYNATLNDDETLFGIITAETGNSLSMKGLDGQDRTVLRSNLKSITSTNRSLMPVGFEEGMSKQEMADLIAFLQNPVPTN